MGIAEPLRVVAAIVLAGGSIYLAANGIKGWGWFLAAAAVLGTTVVIV